MRYLLINETEGKQITGEVEPKKIAAYLLERYPNMRVVLTLGSKGVYYQDKQKCCLQDGFRVHAVDTTGAGDTFTGFFLGTILGGLSEEEALRWAWAAAALSVTDVYKRQKVQNQVMLTNYLQGRHGMPHQTQSIDEHEELINSIEAGDRERAERAIECHINRAFLRVRGE